MASGCYGRFGMFSLEGDEECNQVLAMSRTWDELFVNIKHATHEEMCDTVVRERMSQAFDQTQVEAGRETYLQYLHRLSGEPGPPPPVNPDSGVTLFLLNDPTLTTEAIEQHRQRQAAYQTEMQEYNRRMEIWNERRRQQEEGEQ